MKNLRRSVLLLVALVSALVVTNVFADVESVQGAVIEIGEGIMVNFWPHIGHKVHHTSLSGNDSFPAFFTPRA